MAQTMKIENNSNAQLEHTKVEKTVYIIGAGFSKGLGAPLQTEILKEIIELDISDLYREERKIFENSLKAFRSFLRNQLCLSPGSFTQISLEDIYTPIDRCIIDNISFRNLDKKSLIDLRQSINALIVIMMRRKLRKLLFDNFEVENYAQRFAKYLVDIKRKNPINSDPLSILSLNWDIILDNALFHETKREEARGNRGVVDYCCYILPYNKNDNFPTGLYARGSNQFNLKILKLHGSMNWLQCQRCQRLFIAFDEKIAAEEFLSTPTCRLCEKNFSNLSTNDVGAHLISQLVMPTFLKDLNNVQLKLIWQNACVELSEAEKIVFLGYSFPAADFELRQLLARSVRHNARIEVVLKDRPNDLTKDSPEKRYRSFFGRRKIKFFYKGVEDYINKLVKSTDSIEIDKSKAQINIRA